MQCFLGIDGGGTHTRALVLDGRGETGGWGRSGMSNLNHARPQEVAAHLREAILQAFARAGCSPSHCLAAFAGMAGVTDDAARQRVAELLPCDVLGAARITVDHDIRIALAGGLAGRPGLALIVGTGSSCYGRDAAGHAWQTGGWEALISDEGSGFYLGREALAVAARMADGRDPETSLRQVVFDWLGIADISALQGRIHVPGLPRHEIAAFAPTVVALAESGDPAARAILRRGADLLAELVAANHRRCPTGPRPEVVLCGGLGLAETLYRRDIVEAIGRRMPEARCLRPVLPPTLGAVLLAMRSVEEPVAVERLQRWQEPPPDAAE